MSTLNSKEKRPASRRNELGRSLDDFRDHWDGLDYRKGKNGPLSGTLISEEEDRRRIIQASGFNDNQRVFLIGQYELPIGRQNDQALYHRQQERVNSVIRRLKQKGVIISKKDRQPHPVTALSMPTKPGSDSTVRIYVQVDENSVVLTNPLIGFD